jgi:hypothetical protein
VEVVMRKELQEELLSAAQALTEDTTWDHIRGHYEVGRDSVRRLEIVVKTISDEAVELLGNPGNNQVEGDFAPFAYAFVDAMLAARGPKC